MTKDKTNIEEIKGFDWFKWKFRHKVDVSNWMRNRGYDDFDSIDMEELQETLEDYSWELCSEVEKDFTPKSQRQAECEDALDFMYAQISINSWEVNGIRETSLHNVAEALKLAKSKLKKEQRKHE